MYNHTTFGAAEKWLKYILANRYMNKKGRNGKKSKNIHKNICRFH